MAYISRLALPYTEDQINDECMEVGERIYNETYGLGTIVCGFNSVCGMPGVRYDTYHENLIALDGRCEDGHGCWETKLSLTVVEYMYPCNKCGKDCTKDSEDDYVLTEVQWTKIEGHGHICLDCSQKLLGREFRATDFTLCESNMMNPFASKLILQYVKDNT